MLVGGTWHHQLRVLCPVRACRLSVRWAERLHAGSERNLRRMRHMAHDWLPTIWLAILLMQRRSVPAKKGARLSGSECVTRTIRCCMMGDTLRSRRLSKRGLGPVL